MQNWGMRIFFLKPIDKLESFITMVKLPDATQGQNLKPYLL